MQGRTTSKSFATFRGGDVHTLTNDPKVDLHDQRPDDGTCESCGAGIEPVQLEHRRVWHGPPRYCWECAGDGLPQETDGKTPDMEDAQEAWERCGAGGGMRQRAAKLGGPAEPFRQIVEPSTGIDGLYVYGPTGAGKTTMALAALRYALIEAVRGGRGLPDVRYARLPDVMTSAQDAFDGGTWSWSPYQTADVLVVGDLGAVDRTTEWAREVRDSLVNARYESQGATIWTSQVAPGRLDDEAWPDRLMRRIASTVRAPDGRHCYRMSSDHDMELMEAE